MSLTQFLSRFNSATIQRSADYVQQIKTNSIEIVKHGSTVVMYAKVSGSSLYKTNITYNEKQDKITNTDCSCPVGYDCKHAAALARMFYADYREFLNGKARQTPTLQNAQNWLNYFQHYLTQQEPNTTTKINHFIYILKPAAYTTKIDTHIYKTRINKIGEIQEVSHYSSYDNIIRKRIKLSESQRHLFSKIYACHQLNQDNHYDKNHLELTGIELVLFQQLIASGDVYWQDHKNPALTWSNQTYNLTLNWKNGTQPNTEQLEINLMSAQQHISLQQHPYIKIFSSQPPCYIDTQQHIVGQLNSDYQAEILQYLLDMPEMPIPLLEQFEQLINQYPKIKNLPKPKNTQNMPVLAGNPTPILRFGVFPEFDKKAHIEDYAFAEVIFEYQGGQIKPNIITDNFIGKYQNKAVRQQRDLIQEQQAIQRLKNIIPSLKWVKNLAAKKRPNLSQEKLDTLICAEPNDWLQQLIPRNNIEIMGWKIEHTPHSLFNLQLAQHIELSLQESENQLDWFNIGATIQDQQGNRYDLIELLAGLIQRHPFIIENAALEKMDDDGIFTIHLGNHQPDLALSVKEIKPILKYLGHILQQPESQQIDRYDAIQFLELQHHLGMAWQTSDHLKQFAEKLQQTYQQQLPTPQGFHGELRPYQQQGLAWLQFLKDTQHCGILADDMGLGKTAQTLAHILMEQQAGYLQQKPVLIVAPTSLMQNWFKEAQKFTPDLKVLILQGQQRKDYFNDIPNYDIILTTYPLLARDEELLQQHQYHLLILDEAQNIKNPRAKAAQVVRQIKSDHRLCLTGTPMENHLGELWSLFYFLMPGFLYSQDIFNKKYRHPIEKHGDQQLKQKLVNRIKPFMLRRLKTDVAKELPEKTTIEVNIDMNEQQSKLYEAVRATMQKNIQAIIAEQGFNRSQIHILDALLKLRQVCCHPSLLKLETINTEKATSTKLEHLLQMVTEMVEEGRKILIFSQFTSMLQLIEDGLKTQKIALVKLTGQTKKRDEVITAFQSGQVPVFLISLKAGGVGLNLTAADTVIHYDPWWNPAAEDQASDRAWRIGQDKPVFVYKLITNQSIEERILALQKNKAQLAQSILSTDHEGEVKLNQEDVMKLFEGF